MLWYSYGQYQMCCGLLAQDITVYLISMWVSIQRKGFFLCYVHFMCSLKKWGLTPDKKKCLNIAK